MVGTSRSPIATAVPIRLLTQWESLIVTDDERCRLRDIAKRVCERWGNELKNDPSAFTPINERLHSSFTDEECSAIFASWIKHQDEYATDGVERENVTPFVFPPLEDKDEEFPVSGSVIWGLLCINRDVLATPETLQRGKSWLVEKRAIKAEQPSQLEPKASLTSCKHSENFECVNWHGEVFTFSDSQAAVIRKLWYAWEAGTPWLCEETLLEAIDHACTVRDKKNLRDVFRSNGKNHPAWDTMIVRESNPNRNKLFGLAVPEKSS